MDERTISVDLFSDYGGVLLADTQSFYGGDTADLRIRSQTDQSASLFLQEERSRDSEVNHILEDVGFVQVDEFLFA